MAADTNAVVTGSNKVAQVWARLSLVLGESLLYDAASQTLYAQDVFEHHLYVFDLSKDGEGSKPVRHLDLSDDLGMIGLIEGDDKHLIASAKRGVAKVSLEDGSLTYLCRFNEPEDEARYRANDGVIDARGRLWSGTHPDFIDPNAGGMEDTPREGFLFRFDPDGTLHRVLEKMAAPNGMNFSNDNKTFYMIDSFYHCIFAYDYDLENGSISNERTLIKFDSKYGVPDGAHITTDDKIYVAMAFGESNVLIVDPTQRGEGDGKIIGQVTTDALMTTCASFAGPGMQDLYITTASVEKMVPGIKEKDKNCGSIFKFQTDTIGAPRHKFGQNSLKSANFRKLAESPYSLGTLGLACMPAVLPKEP